MRPQNCVPRPQYCGSKNIKTHKIHKERERMKLRGCHRRCHLGGYIMSTYYQKFFLKHLSLIELKGCSETDTFFPFHHDRNVDAPLHQCRKPLLRPFNTLAAALSPIDPSGA
ncbi:hypothetical protein XENOCAPTIV_022449 [Xenoophorus captivus]|uniref:Uncharacterized protein n=1 Tax=Xenoophorus captivus TaxID=1517983 RepID=A0ABV0S8A9_9TELE